MKEFIPKLLDSSGFEVVQSKKPCFPVFTKIEKAKDRLIFMDVSRVFGIVRVSELKKKVLEKHFIKFVSLSEFAGHNFLMYLTEQAYFREKHLLEVVKVAELFGYAEKHLVFYFPKKESPMFVTIAWGKVDFCFCLAPCHPQKSEFRLVKKRKKKEVKTSG